VHSYHLSRVLSKNNSPTSVANGNESSELNSLSLSLSVCVCVRERLLFFSLAQQTLGWLCDNEPSFFS
jgi:hypothetical protein